MIPTFRNGSLVCSTLLAAGPLLAAPSVTPGFNATDAGFKFDKVDPPALNDAAAKGTFSIIDGDRDRNSADLSALNDGKVPNSADQPQSNFFFAMNTDGGRLGLDLGSLTAVKSIGTYSWHGGGRGPQVYSVYGANGKAKDFNASPTRGTDPRSCGWELIAEVDTRPKSGKGEGQHGVEIANRGGRALGNYQHLLFDIQRTSPDDAHGNTFFSEIDVIDARGPEIERIKPPEKIVKNYKSADGKYRYIIDSSKAPALTEWCEKELLPTIEEWYPKLVEMLPSDGYRAPDVVIFEFRDDMGGTPAYAAGNKISMSAPWFPGQLQREAKGCVVHEMGHVVQNYWRARQTNRNPKPTPGWITEGICDYIRWFLFEPESQGAHVRNVNQARYDASYRVSANFLDWVCTEKDKDLFKKLNAAAREGRYEEKLWKEWTGSTLEELSEGWKKDVEKGKR
ncbi:basic secretory protein-like protein [Luteolibacter marinus]|uniref:basic secretory protein-like protein n=1 Tax=Luteolibacter marinus TaxID=2776705 RepID=UPI001865B5A6|nr:basic secretory protein-like protein [Luteolibacter marinus]